MSSSSESSQSDQSEIEEYIPKRKRVMKRRCSFVMDDVSDTSGEESIFEGSEDEADVDFVEPESLDYLRRRVQITVPRTPIKQQESREEIAENFEAIRETRKQLMAVGGRSTLADIDDYEEGSFINDDSVDDLLDYNESELEYGTDEERQ